MKYINQITKNAQNQLGDTIVEVLLAIGIAAFAIGISYATAQRSLDKSITAREHNQALNLIENQLADLKLRFQNSTPTDPFSTAIAPKNHFCLNDSANDPTKASTWDPYQNDSSVSQSSPLASSPAPDGSHPYYYNPSAGPPAGCENQQPGDGADYFIDITTQPGSSTGPDNILYTITVRWSPVGGGQTNQASINYKLNSSNSRTLGDSALGGGLPPTCPLPSPNPISETDPVLKRLNSSPGFQTFTYRYTDQPYTNTGNATPWNPNLACTYSITITDHIKSPVPSPPQNNEQMFIQFCNAPASCEYTSQLTPDINELVIPATETVQFSHQFSGNSINYLKVGHCSIYPGPPPGCSTQLNEITGYDITVTGS
jgi:type II secretory pathway pseudopilin PulG